LNLGIVDSIRFLLDNRENPNVTEDSVEKKKEAVFRVAD
jgi:hypothetical protein